MTKVAVVDNHGQFTHLERRALRDAGVEAEIVENTTPPGEVLGGPGGADGVVLSGGPNVDRTGRCGEYLAPGVDVPVLGICLGMQAMAVELGGAVGPGEYGGYADVTVSILEESDPLVGSLAPETAVWASHADEVKRVPEGFARTAESDVCRVEAMAHPRRDLYGVQWHPEVAHTAEGAELFENFVSLCEA